jgi:hypothetical protein
MGMSDDWQNDITDYFTNQGIDVYNPRRLDWNNSWKQGKDDEPFREQVLWELDHLEKCDHILMYFAPNSKSPISLLELGLFKDKSIFVVCPTGFYRKGNVDIVCERYDIPVFADMESFKSWFVVFNNIIKCLSV